MTVNLSDLFPAETLTRVIAPVAEQVYKYDEAAITAGGLFRAAHLAISKTIVASGEFDGHVVTAGNGKIMVAYRKNSTGIIYVAGYTINQDGTLTAIGSTQTISVSVLGQAGSPMFAAHLDTDYFALAYKDTSSSAKIRVVDLSGASPAFGTAVTTAPSSSGSYWLGMAAIPGSGAVYQIFKYATATESLKLWTRSGTTLNETALSLPSAAGTITDRSLKAIGGTSGAPHFITVAIDSAAANAMFIEKFYLSGTTITYVNRVNPPQAAASGMDTEEPLIKIQHGSSNQYLCLQRNTSNGQVAGLYSGAANATSLTIGSNTTTGVASPGPVIWNGRDLAFNYGQVSGSDYIIKKVTIGSGGTTIAIATNFNTITGQENTYNNAMTLAYDSVTKTCFQSWRDVSADDDIGVIKYGSTEPLRMIGTFQDNGAVSTSVVVALLKAITGIMQQVKVAPGNLIPGQNYYGGTGVLSTDSAATPFVGWAITAENLIFSQSALS